MRPIVMALTIVMVCSAWMWGFAASPDALAGALIWQREGIAAGEVWRLLTAHLLHLSEHHLLMNLLGLLLITELLCERFSSAAFLSLLLVSALGVGLLLLLAPQLRWYAGFSGVLHGLWSGSASLNWLRDRTRLDLFALLALIIKLACVNPGTADIPVVVEAHLYGALSGLLWLGLMQACQRRTVFD